jgi:hypothetical protein
MALALVSLQAVAETKMGGRDFNHNTTGFTLSGGHATAACETCHVGGVFKGTPKNCDDCHAVGKRILATPKSNNHIVTDAPCGSCHFNTATWLGARYNHGAAKPGQCITCHNGRQATGKPASHNIGRKATDSCDQCHRRIAWIPASWNHSGVTPGTCTTCHNGSTAIGKPGTHTTVAKSTYQCDECHGFTGWFPAAYKHNTAGVCSSCHNGTTAIGKPASHTAVSVKGTNPCSDCHKIQGWIPATYTHTATGSCMTCHDGIKAVGKHLTHIATTDDCNACHTSTTTWAGALGAKPANHIPYNSGVSCGSCHTGAGIVTGPTMHSYVTSSTCMTCHLKGTSYLGSMDKKGIGHEGWSGTGDCSQSGCHKPAGSRGTAYINWD